VSDGRPKPHGKSPASESGAKFGSIELAQSGLPARDWTAQQTRRLKTEPQIWLHSAWEATEKAPPRERGLKWGQSFLTKGLAARRSQRHRQDDMGSGIGGATDENAEPSHWFLCRAGRPPGMKTKRG
jgi:hypothetical protein